MWESGEGPSIKRMPVESNQEGSPSCAWRWDILQTWRLNPTHSTKSFTIQWTGEALMDANPTSCLSSTHHWLDFRCLLSPRIFGDPASFSIFINGARIICLRFPILLHWNSKFYLIQASSHYPVGEGALSKPGRYFAFCCSVWNGIASDILCAEMVVSIN